MDKTAQAECQAILDKAVSQMTLFFEEEDKQVTRDVFTYGRVTEETQRQYNERMKEWLSRIDKEQVK